MDELLVRLTPHVRKAFNADLEALREGVTFRDLERMIGQRDIEGAILALGIAPAVFREVERELTAVFEDAGKAVTRLFPRNLRDRRGMIISFRFDMRHEAAERWLERLSGTLITRLTEGQLATAREVLAEGLREGRNPRAVATDLVGRINRATQRREGGALGLTAPQARSLRNMQEYLDAGDRRYFQLTLRDKRFDRSIKAALDAGKPVGQDTILKAARSYSNRLLQHRGEVVAKTETLNTIRGAKHIAFTQGAQQAGLPATAVEREWSDTGDGREREDHGAADGQRVQGNEPFVVGGELMMYPGDTSFGASGAQTIGCRCYEIHRVDWIGQLNG